MPERIVLHIGTQKTGSTSLQHFLHEHADLLASEAGASYPPGFVLPASHSELPLLSIRSDRQWPARLRLPETGSPEWLAAAEAHVRAQIEGTSEEVLVLSHEDLSYLRFDDELDRLRGLLRLDDVRVVVFLRRPAEFLRSYRAQLIATGFELSDDPSSFAYVEDDSWLVDHDALVSVYRRHLGANRVEVLDYDDVVRRDGSVIPTFVERLGIPRSVLPPLDSYFLNHSGNQIRLTDEQLSEIRRRLADQAQ